MFFHLSLHSFTNCSDTLNWMVYGDDLSACTSPGSSNTNIYHYACTFKVINCRGEIIEMFVYQVVGSSPGAVICDWKPGLFLACTKKKKPIILDFDSGNSLKRQHFHSQDCRSAAAKFTNGFRSQVPSSTVFFRNTVTESRERGYTWCGLIKPYFVLKCLSERES